MSGVIKVRVKFESSLRGIAGVAAMDVELAEGASVQDLLERVGEICAERAAGGAPIWPWANHIVVLRNADTVERVRYRNTPLAAGDVLFLVPPIAGGGEKRLPERSRR